MKSRLLEVIIVNWNRSTDVLALVENLQAELRPYDATITIVDNGSGAEDLAKLSTLQSQIPCTTLRLDKNYGPLHARNLAGLKSEAQYLLYVDSDGLLEAGTVSALLKRMQSNPQWGIVGGKSLNFTSRELDVWIFPQDPKKFENISFETYSFLCGIALIDTATFQDVAGFWTELFMAMEESDLSLKFIQRGKKISYEPQAVLLHKVSPFGRLASQESWYLRCRNTFVIHREYLPRGLAALYFGIYLVVFSIKGLRLGFFRQVLRALKFFVCEKMPHSAHQKLSYRQGIYYFRLMVKLKIKFAH